MVVLDVLRNGAPEVPLPDRNHPVQTFFFEIITTASCALFPLVEAGVFDAALYYRLNVLLLRVSSPFQSGLLVTTSSAPRHSNPIAISTSPFV